ncbi:MAG: hypothetical protein JSV10_07060 [Candidatus Zixiibacteriota bacterium]|nr:MAG: hypothetical protein JSV10_07060 [candidate division Zixibacteria bacterium]
MNGGGVAAIIVITDGILKAFKKNEALSPDRARTKVELDIRSRWIFNNLVSKGVIKKVSGDRYYVDLQAQERYLRRRNTALVVVTCTVITAAIIAAFVWR